MADAAPQLQQAYDLIEAGDLQSARQILDEIRSDNENNPDFWWVYAHAVEDEAEGRNAITRVRQLAPNYPGLDELSRELGMPVPQSINPVTPPPPPMDAPSTEDVDEFYEDEADASPVSTNTGSQGNPLLILGAVAVLATIIIVLFLISLLGGGNNADSDDGNTQVAVTQELSPEPVIPTSVAESSSEEPTVEAEPTEVEPTDEIVDEVEDTVVPTEAEDEEPTDQPEPTPTQEVIPTETEEEPTDVPTEEPTAEPEPTEVEPTDEPAATEVEPTEAEDEPTDVAGETDPIVNLYDDLAAFGVPTDSIRVEETEEFGDTYFVPTCSSIGPVATQNIIGIIDTLQDSADDLEDVGGYAFEITDCDGGDVSLTLALDSDTISQYWAGDVDASNVQQSLRRLN